MTGKLGEGTIELRLDLKIIVNLYLSFERLASESSYLLRSCSVSLLKRLLSKPRSNGLKDEGDGNPEGGGELKAG